MSKLFGRADDSSQFPASYPSGCLLGCVDVVECLSQEEYREQVHAATSAVSVCVCVYYSLNPRPYVLIQCGLGSRLLCTRSRQLQYNYQHLSIKHKLLSDNYN